MAWCRYLINDIIRIKRNEKERQPRHLISNINLTHFSTHSPSRVPWRLKVSHFYRHLCHHRPAQGSPCLRRLNDDRQQISICEDLIDAGMVGFLRHQHVMHICFVSWGFSNVLGLFLKPSGSWLEEGSKDPRCRRMNMNCAGGHVSIKLCLLALQTWPKIEILCCRHRRYSVRAFKFVC